MPGCMKDGGSGPRRTRAACDCEVCGLEGTVICAVCHAAHRPHSEAVMNGKGRMPVYDRKGNIVTYERAQSKSRGAS